MYLVKIHGNDYVNLDQVLWVQEGSAIDGSHHVIMENGEPVKELQVCFVDGTIHGYTGLDRERLLTHLRATMGLR